MPSPDDPRFRAQFTAGTQLSPSLRRLRFTAEDPAGFALGGDPDERVLIEFDGGHRRSYTVRGHDAAATSVEIDFATHTGGAAAEWARTARPGATVRLSRAKGWWHPPTDATRLILAADLAALPAAGRIAESLPAHVTAHVIAEVPDPDDRQHWDTAADVTLTWLTGTGNGISPTVLPEALAAAPDLDRADYVWSCGETSASRRVRAHLRRTLGWPAERYHVMGYWQADRERWLERYAEVEDRIEALTARELASGRTVDEVRDVIDDALAEAGL